jgi:hypothetical protein
MLGLFHHLSAGTASLTLALAPPAPAPLDPNIEVPGGYHDAMDLRTNDEPVDGDKQITLGSVLFSLGLIQAMGGISSYVTATPTYCDKVYGASVSDETCAGLRIYGIIGTAFGGLMAATGASFLGWGLIQRKRHREWKRERGLTIGPLMGPGQRGLAIGFRF